MSRAAFGLARPAMKHKNDAFGNPVVDICTLLGLAGRMNSLVVNNDVSILASRSYRIGYVEELGGVIIT